MQESEGLRWPCPVEAGAGSHLASVGMAWLQLGDARGTRRQGQPGSRACPIPVHAPGEGPRLWRSGPGGRELATGLQCV